MASAAEIANRIHAVIEGEPTAEVYAALSMVIGAGAAQAKRPDLDKTIELVATTARWEFDRRRQPVQ